MAFENIIVETKGRVGIIRLNRPQALNALNRALIAELIQAIDAYEADEKIGCLLLTGNEKAFAAGADIKEMADKTFIEVYLGNFAGTWDRASRTRKPIVAAAASSPCNATSSSRRIMPNSASPRSSSASFPVSAARNGSRARSARPRRW